MKEQKLIEMWNKIAKIESYLGFIGQELDTMNKKISSNMLLMRELENYDELVNKVKSKIEEAQKKKEQELVDQITNQDGKEKS